MEYNVHVLARTYVKGFYKFITEHTTIKSSQEAYNLLMYAVKKLYGLESIEYSTSIEKYGSSCIKYLSKLKGTVKKPKNVDRDMASSIVDLCGAYAVTMDLLIAKHISNGRIVRVTPYNEAEDDD